MLTHTPSLSRQQIQLEKHTTGSHGGGKAWYRNSFGGNGTFQQCFHTFAAIIAAVETMRRVWTVS